MYGHKLALGTKASKAKWHNEAKDTLYDFAPKIDADIRATQKHLADTELRLGHKWVIEDTPEEAAAAEAAAPLAARVVARSASRRNDARRAFEAAASAAAAVVACASACAQSESKASRRTARAPRSHAL